MKIYRLMFVVLAMTGICFFGKVGFASERPSSKDAQDARKCQHTPDEKNKNTGETPSEESVRVYEVFGMDCPGCHGAVNKLVEKIPGVEKSEADWVKKQVTVTIRPGAQVDDEDVYDAIKRANFTPGKRLK